MKSIHKYIKFEIEDTFYVIKNSNNIENINVGNALIKTFNTSSEEIDELEENFNKNFEKDLEYNQEYGDQALFKKYNINVDILHAFYWVKANESQGDDFIYDELLNKFNLNKNEIIYLEMNNNLIGNEIVMRMSPCNRCCFKCFNPYKPRVFLSF